MDTPEKTQKQQLGTPLSSRFEDSPVFNYINSLSPIKPVKSIHFGQTFNSINFASIPSVFTSPHANVQKESRFLARQPLSDLSKPQFSSELNRDESNLCTGVLDVVKISDSSVSERPDGIMKCSLNRAVTDPPEECSTDPSSQYKSGSPDPNIQPHVGCKSNFKLVMGSSLVEFIHDGLDERNIQSASAIDLESKHGTEEEKETSACDWGTIMSNNTRDLLIFDSSQEPEPQNEMGEYCPDGDNKLTSLSEDSVPISREFKTDCPLYLPRQRFLCDLPRSCNAEIAEDIATDHTPLILSAGHDNPVTIDPCENVEDKNCSSHDSESKVEFQHQRGLRRRCLVFELSGARRKSLHNTLSKNTPAAVPCFVKLSSQMEEATSSKGGTGLPDCFLPGVGLHLNSLATLSKDAVIIEDNHACGMNLIGMPYTINPCSTNGHECKQESLAHDKDNGSYSELLDLAIMHDPPLDNAAAENDDQNRKSQKKKRKAENPNEIDGCKRCNCKKSKCLKLYCECFAAGVYCVDSCTCRGCFNKPIHEDTVLATRKQIESRNPLAFAPKVIRASEPLAETGDETNKTPASARHKRGCNCKKSNCLKKYCECFQGGAGCSMSCRCEGCRNTFGRKDGSIPMEISEAEPEKEATIFEKDKDMDIPDSEQDGGSILNKEQSSENPLLITPSQIPRPPVPMPCPGKPPRAVFSIGSSIMLNTSAPLSRKEAALPDSMFNKNLPSSAEEESPDILRDSCTTPVGMVKVTSPNRKRISPPCSESGLSPSARKGCRKLILKSIPSFPSLVSEPNEHPTNISGSSSFKSSLC